MPGEGAPEELNSVWIIPVGDTEFEQISRSKFWGYVYNGCDSVNNIIIIEGKQYQLDTATFTAPIE